MAETQKTETPPTQVSSGTPADDTPESAEADKDYAWQHEGEHRTAFFAQHEAQATGEHEKLTPAEEKARKRRSIAIALGVVAFVALVYLITMLRLSQNVGGPS